jgi:hypothetical protein
LMAFICCWEGREGEELLVFDREFSNRWLAAAWEEERGALLLMADVELCLEKLPGLGPTVDCDW